MFTGIRSIFAAALTTALLAAGLSAATHDERVLAHIPFAFEFAGSPLPAGDYTIEQLGRANVITITNELTQARISALVRTTDVAVATSGGNVVFARSAGKVTLRRVLMPNGSWLDLRTEPKSVSVLR